MNIRRKIYYDLATGNVLLHLPEQTMVKNVQESTVEQDIKSFKVLSERNQETFDVLILEIGQYSQDFAESNGYQVNPTTKTLEFSYPDPNVPEVEPVFQKPLSEEITRLTKENKDQDLVIEELMFVIIPELTGGI